MGLHQWGSSKRVPRNDSTLDFRRISSTTSPSVGWAPSRNTWPFNITMRLARVREYTEPLTLKAGIWLRRAGGRAA